MRAASAWQSSARACRASFCATRHPRVRAAAARRLAPPAALPVLLPPRWLHPWRAWSAARLLPDTGHWGVGWGSAQPSRGARVRAACWQGILIFMHAHWPAPFCIAYESAAASCYWLQMHALWPLATNAAAMGWACVTAHKPRPAPWQVGPRCEARVRAAGWGCAARWPDNGVFGGHMRAEGRCMRLMLTDGLSSPSLLLPLDTGGFIPSQSFTPHMHWCPHTAFRRGAQALAGF